MSHPLEQSYNWRTPATFASIAAVICVGALAHGQTNGWLPALLVVVALWALVVGIIYLRTRAYLMVDGTRLTVCQRVAIALAWDRLVRPGIAHPNNGSLDAPRFPTWHLESTTRGQRLRSTRATHGS